jgi:diguanylate cyclase (GGDEF)-like protein/PAS domain S-box-containing protein
MDLRQDLVSAAAAAGELQVDDWESVDLLNVFLETTSDNVYFKDLESRFRAVSDAQARWLGVDSTADLLGKSDFDFFDAEHAQRAFDDEREIIRTGEPIVNFEEADTWKDGRVAWVSTTKMPLKNRHGETIGTFGISRDITARKLAEQAVQENQQRMAALIAAQRDAAMSSGTLQTTLELMADRAQKLTHAAGAALLFLEEGVLVARAATGLLADARDLRLDPGASALGEWLEQGLPRCFDDAQEEAAVAAAALSPQARSLMVVPIRHEGRVAALLLAVQPEPAVFRPEDVESLELLSVVVTAAIGQDELRAHAELSAHRALHDALTELPNRVLFGDRIQQALLTAEREGGRCAVLLMDLDRFKEINDTLGHAAGDHVLKVVSTRLNGCLRASDTVARLGGDEFGLLLPKQTEPSEIVRLLDKISAAIEEPIDLDGLPLAIESSIGVAFYPDHGLTSEELMQRADVAMYTAKQESIRYAYYDSRADDHDPLRLTIIGELRRAIEQRELVLYYQPKAELRDGTVTSVEALLRWFHPERGMVPPDEFIPQAQETGLMKPLTLYVLDEALRQSREWQDAGVELTVSVNLATRNLLDVAFPDDVAAALERWGVDPSRLELEITESTMLDDPFRTKIVLDRLHDMGIRLSIDDFGTGYSSLAYLRQLPVSEIKIDRSFVLHMDENPDDAVIVRSTIDLGRNLGLRVVAEGVETIDAWNQLEELGCDVAQGYFLSRPVPAADLVAWLGSRASA